MMEYCRLYDSPIGPIMLSSDGNALIGLFFRSCDGSDELPVFDETCRWLDIYFGGKVSDFMPSIAFCGTAFQNKVWQALLSIPYGKTVSYGDIARRIGCRSAQAIGGAVHRNPIAIIVPCHRVIGADGSLTGYASGLDKKRYLLQLEGIAIS